MSHRFGLSFQMVLPNDHRTDRDAGGRSRIPSKHDCPLRITAELTEKSHCGRVCMNGLAEWESCFLFRNWWLYSAEYAPCAVESGK